MMVNSSDHLKAVGIGCDLWGPQRLALALHLLPSLKEFVEVNTKSTFFIENGTLLGAWRNGMFIPHDDDFDFAMLFSRETFKDNPNIPSPPTKEDDVALKIWHDASLNVLKTLKDFLDQRLETKYKTRIVDSYCYKLEVYEPFHGKYTLLPNEHYEGADFHYVTADIQAYVEVYRHGKFVFSPIYRGLQDRFIPGQIIFPAAEITLERHIFPAPQNAKRWLEISYGCLEEGAVYDETTRKYVMPSNNKDSNA